MEISKVKIALIDRIISTDDVNLLNRIQEIINKFETFSLVNEPLHTYETSEQIHALNDWQKERIKKALKQVDNGEFITNEKAEIEIEKWFQEQEKLYGQ
jgi:predicted transcriptional regulator